MAGRGNSLAWRVVAAILLIGALVTGGLVAHRLGWVQGYAAAVLSAQGLDAPRLPLAAPGWRPVAFGYGSAVLVYVILGLVLLAVLGTLLRVVTWGALGVLAMCHHAAGGWGRRQWNSMRGPAPLWCRPRDEESREGEREGKDRAHAEA
ncbi:MAG: hypothetical protein PVJ55_05085 [Anaerolineae bacterium]|jgi:hypothetical protein